MTAFTYLWWTGKMDFLNQSGKRCPDWPEIMREWSKTEIGSSRGRQSTQSGYSHSALHSPIANGSLGHFLHITLQITALKSYLEVRYYLT